MPKKVKTKNTVKNAKKKSLLGRVWNIICWPFRKNANFCRRFWKWVCGVDLIGLTNTTLLIAIIVLFSMLIIDVVGCNKKQVVVVAKPVPLVEQVTITNDAAPKPVTLPIANNSAKKMVNVVPVKKTEVEIVKKQTARKANKLMGDVIIDSRGAGAILQCGTQVNGNLYLQNMRKYTLPCDIRINGNLFLRDVNMLQFCGDFVVTGNIYVSPRSSFGPIPKTARVGGYVVL